MKARTVKATVAKNAGRKEEASEKTELAPLEAQYAIDIDWLEGKGRSFTSMVIGRLGPNYQPPPEAPKKPETKADKKPASKQLAKKTTKPSKGDPWDLLVNKASKEDGYITLETPLLEAVFRVLLANRNQPMSLTHVMEALAKWGIGPGNARNVNKELLQLLVSKDQFYGIRVVG